MNPEVLAHVNAYALMAVVAHWLALWLGVYIAGRRPRSKAAWLAGLAFVCGAAYLLKAAYYFIPTTAEGVVQRERWLGGWVAFTPVLLLHAFMLLTEFRPRWGRWLLGVAYSLAALVFIWGLFGEAFGEFGSMTFDEDAYLESLPPGRFYWVTIVQMVLTLAASLAVLMRARLARPALPRTVGRQLNMLIVGLALLSVGVGQILVSGLIAAPIPDAVLFPIGVMGALMLGVPLMRYSGRMGGQLLRSDAMSSLLVAVIVLALFVTASAAAGASAASVAGTGWLVVVMVALGADLRTLTDRLFYGRAGRAARAGLRVVEAYAGTTRQLNMEAVAPSQAGEVIGYLGDLDRAQMGFVAGEPRDEQWLRVLARDEFAPVREALGIPSDWSLGDPLSREEIRERMAVKLVPRERQALGLWYMGYSDKEMARLMEVRPGVPRSYLNEGKKKLGLPAGPALMMFAHFSGFVGTDALPLSDTETLAVPPESATGRPR